MKPQVLEDQPSTRGVDAGVARKANDTWLEPLFESILAILIGLLALWLSLTVVGFIRLRGAVSLFPQSPDFAVGVAMSFAIIFCVFGFPLMLPWLLAFVLAEFLLPRKSVLWNWWVRTPLGMIAGVFALWSDACAYSLLSSGTLFDINVPLLQSASLPAAIMAGAACLSANVGAKFVKNVFSV